MQNISQIMCVIDPTTTAQPAMQRAAWLAGKTGAEIELFICYYNEYLSDGRLGNYPSLENAQEDILGGLKRRLELLAEPLRESGLVVKTTAVWDHPLYEGIVRHAAAVGADVVLKDTPPPFGNLARAPDEHRLEPDSIVRRATLAGEATRRSGKSGLCRRN